MTCLGTLSKNKHHKERLPCADWTQPIATTLLFDPALCREEGSGQLWTTRWRPRRRGSDQPLPWTLQRSLRTDTLKQGVVQNQVLCCVRLQTLIHTTSKWSRGHRFLFHVLNLCSLEEKKKNHIDFIKPIPNQLFSLFQCIRLARTYTKVNSGVPCRGRSCPQTKCPEPGCNHTNAKRR